MIMNSYIRRRFVNWSLSRTRVAHRMLAKRKTILHDSTSYYGTLWHKKSCRKSTFTWISYFLVVFGSHTTHWCRTWLYAIVFRSRVWNITKFFPKSSTAYKWMSKSSYIAAQDYKYAKWIGWTARGILAPFSWGTVNQDLRDTRCPLRKLLSTPTQVIIPLGEFVFPGWETLVCIIVPLCNPVQIVWQLPLNWYNCSLWTHRSHWCVSVYVKY